MFHTVKYNNNKVKKIKTRSSIALAFVSLYCIIFGFTYWSNVENLPQGYHQWAQADRLAVALRYADGKPLMTPATYSLKTEDGNVGVEFSGIQYLISLPFRGYGSTKYLPAFYKIFTFTLLFVTLFWLVFHLLAAEHLFFRCGMVLLLLSSPMLLHYGFSYLPDVWALSLILISLVLFFKDYSKYIYTILIISGLAMLIKTSSGIYFCAFYGVFFLQHLKKLSPKLLGVTFLFLAIAAGVAWYDYFYVIEVNKKLWSYVFMSKTNPIASWTDFTNAVETAWRFKKHYFSTPQRWIILILFILSLRKVKVWSLKSPITQFVFLIILGILAIFLFFGVQFMNHDYYVVATIVPALLFFVLVQLRGLAPYIHPRTFIILVCLASISAFSISNKAYFQRTSEIVHINGSAELYPHKWLMSLDTELDSLGTDKSTVFIGYLPEPNHSLLYACRKGAVFNVEEMNRTESPIYHYLPIIRPDFFIIPADREDSFVEKHSELSTRLKLEYKDDNFLIYAIHGY